MDESGNSINLNNCWTAFTELEEAPVLLGFKDVIERLNFSQSPKSNIFIACHINANLGQADFTELSLGYVHRFKFKEKK